MRPRLVCHSVYTLVNKVAVPKYVGIVLMINSD